MISSVSLESRRLHKMLMNVANAHYVRTLLETLNICDRENRYLILVVLQDLIKLNLPLEINEKYVEKPRIQLGNQLANYLYSFVHDCIDKQKDAFETAKNMVKVIRLLPI